MQPAESSAKVEYTYLSPNCGLKVSNLCLGTMTFGQGHPMFTEALGSCNDEDSFALMDKYADLGGNFLDSANIYSQGLSEGIVGNWMEARQNRDRMVVATKARFNMGLYQKDPQNGMGLSRRHLMIAVDDSLKRLKTDYIDLYQIHCWDTGTPIQETLSALNDLVRCGKVRYVGASNVTGWQLQKIVALNEKMGFNQWVTLQQQYNLMARGSEKEAFTVCKNEGMGVLPWSPLKGGFLAGKFKKDQKAEAGTRIAWSSADPKARTMDAMPDLSAITDQEWKLMDKLQELSKKLGRSVAQISLRWLLQTPPVTSVIIGARKMSQLEDNMGAAIGWSLSDDEMNELNELSSTKPTYPYNFVERSNKDRV